MKLNHRIFGLVVAGVIGAVGLDAEDTWLQPERPTATPGATGRLSLTSAAGFNGAETAIKPEGVARMTCVLGGEPLVLAVTGEGERTLEFAAAWGRPGVAVAVVELKPVVRELAAEAVERYFREIHAGEALRAEWAAVPEPRRWRERVVKSGKCFVRVGEPAAAERAWTAPVGSPLEIVPERDPTMLRVGDELPVRVLRRGAPAAGLALSYVSAGESREYVVFTDAEGRARARLDLAGAWIVRGVELRRMAETELEWESDFATMVVEVR